MKIALLTFLDVGNFGANLQATSTYCYLKNHGHDVTAINYQSRKTVVEHQLSRLKRKLMHQQPPVQNYAHHEYICKIIDDQSPLLQTKKEVADYIISKGFDGVIIGSDAVVQHWPLFSTLRLGKHRPFWIEPLQPERRFPNPFWGCGFANHVPTAMMSVSSQNSKYHRFSSYTLERMSKQLSCMKFISVRDEWTRQMMFAANRGLKIEVTPDPVFALNQNLDGLIPKEDEVRKKFKLPSKYVLFGLRSQVFSMDELKEFQTLFFNEGKECVAFCIDGRYNYIHPFKYQISLPVSPLEWFAIIKYASAYIGSNMHPIVSCLTNVVPCYSLDNWGTVNFWGRKINDGSSKIQDVLNQYRIPEYRSAIDGGVCKVSPKDIVLKLTKFPVKQVLDITLARINTYNDMMNTIIASLGSVHV